MTRELRITASELPRSGGALFRVEHRRIAIHITGNGAFAVSDLCSHMGGPLSEGRVEGEEVVCPWHGARFDLSTGRVLSPPAGCDVESFPVRWDGADLVVLLDEDPA